MVLALANAGDVVVAVITVFGVCYTAWVGAANRKQLKNNGGSSLKDAVDRIEKRQVGHIADTQERFDGVHDEMRRGFAQVWRTLNKEGIAPND